jgi:hypothetical protein
MRFGFDLPEIQLQCSSDVCNGERFFPAEDKRVTRVTYPYEEANPGTLNM